MRKIEKKLIFSKPPKGPILSFWILNLHIVICQFQKKSTVKHFFVSVHVPATSAGLITLSFSVLLFIHKIWIKGPQIRSDMPSALGLVQIHLTNLFWTLKVELVCPLNETFSGFGQTQHLFFDCLVNFQMVGKKLLLIEGNVTFRSL